MRKLDTVQYKFTMVEPEQLQAELYSVTLSDGSVDRHGDTISPDGWKLETYKANPVLLWAHDASQLPIGKTLNVRVEGGRLRGEMKFADHAFATEVKKLIDAKILRAVSVGFAPQKYEIAEDRDQGGFFPPVDFKEQELLELSVVPIPANPNALIDGKNKGCDVGLVVEWAKRALETLEGEGLWVPKAKLVQVVRTFEPAKTYSLPPAAPAEAPAAEPELSREQVAEMISNAVKQYRMKNTGRID